MNHSIIKKISLLIACTHATFAMETRLSDSAATPQVAAASIPTPLITDEDGARIKSRLLRNIYEPNFKRYAESELRGLDNESVAEFDAFLTSFIKDDAEIYAAILKFARLSKPQWDMISRNKDVLRELTRSLHTHEAFTAIAEISHFSDVELADAQRIFVQFNYRRMNSVDQMSFISLISKIQGDLRNEDFLNLVTDLTATINVALDFNNNFCTIFRILTTLTNKQKNTDFFDLIREELNGELDRNKIDKLIRLIRTGGNAADIRRNKTRLAPLNLKGYSEFSNERIDLMLSLMMGMPQGKIDVICELQLNRVNDEELQSITDFVNAHFPYDGTPACIERRVNCTEDKLLELFRQRQQELSRQRKQELLQKRKQELLQKRK